MRYRLLKLTKGHSTKAERKFSELLKELHIPFQTKVKLFGREVDFLIGKNVIEIDGHSQDVEKNKQLMDAGYIPIHLNNWEIGLHLKDWLREL